MNEEKSQVREAKWFFLGLSELLIIDNSWIQTKSFSTFVLKITPIAWTEFHECIWEHLSHPSKTICIFKR